MPNKFRHSTTGQVELSRVALSAPKYQNLQQTRPMAVIAAFDIENWYRRIAFIRRSVILARYAIGRRPRSVIEINLRDDNGMMKCKRINAYKHTHTHTHTPKRNPKRDTVCVYPLSMTERVIHPAGAFHGCMAPYETVGGAMRGVDVCVCGPFVVMLGCMPRQGQAAVFDVLMRSDKSRRHGIITGPSATAARWVAGPPWFVGGLSNGGDSTWYRSTITIAHGPLTRRSTNIVTKTLTDRPDGNWDWPLLQSRSTALLDTSGRCW
jgi:hypothetical protein